MDEELAKRYFESERQRAVERFERSVRSWNRRSKADPPARVVWGYSDKESERMFSGVPYPFKSVEGLLNRGDSDFEVSIGQLAVDNGTDRHEFELACTLSRRFKELREFLLEPGRVFEALHVASRGVHLSTLPDEDANGFRVGGVYVHLAVDLLNAPRLERATNLLNVGYRAVNAILDPDDDDGTGFWQLFTHGPNS